MREDIERKIIKRLYRSYKESGKVLKFSATQIFREFGIANGTDVSSIYKSDLVKLDRRENFYITDKGINYMDKVFSKYEGFAGLIKDGVMINIDKEIRAFAIIDKEIQEEQQKNLINSKEWYEKPVGIILLTVIAGLILAFLVWKLGWNN